MLEDIQGLVERCIQRDERAWSEFIERFSGLMYYSARERLRRNGFSFSQHDIEDIIQGIFLEIWEKRLLEKVRERKKIKAWLSIVAQTRALNYKARKKERLLGKGELYKIENIVAEDRRGIDEGMLSRLENAIEEFAPREKIIVKLNTLYGKKHREIARFMNMPVNTVSTIIARKKKILKKNLKNTMGA